MKKCIIMLTILVVLPFFSLSVSAEGEAEEYISDFEEILPDELSGITGDTEELIEYSGARWIFGEILSVLNDGGSEIGAFFLLLIGSSALIGLASLCPGNFSKTVVTCVSIAVSVLIFGRLSRLFLSVTESLSELCDFFGALIPITVGVTALGGGAASATVQSAGMYTALSLIGGFGGEIFSSVSALGLAMSLASSMGSEGALTVSRGVKSLFSWLLGIFTAILTGTLSLQTMIASAADSAAMRAAKYMASGLIPVVGSTVSSALSTLAGGLSYAKGVIGGGAIVALLSIALSPLVMLLAYRLALSIGIILSGFTGGGRASGIFSAYRFSLDTLIALYALSAVIFIFQTVLFIKIGVALL